MSVSVGSVNDVQTVIPNTVFVKIPNSYPGGSGKIFIFLVVVQLNAMVIYKRTCMQLQE